MPVPEDPDEQIVSDTIAQLKGDRERQGLSMYRVAQLASLDERTISKVEAGSQNPTLYTLLKIARAQGITLSRLLAKAERSKE